MSDVGGDPACWLERVCDECGAFVEAGEDHTCRVPARSRDDGDAGTVHPDRPPT